MAWRKFLVMPYYTQGFAHEMPVSFVPMDILFHSFASLRCLLFGLAMLGLPERGYITCI